MQTFLPNPDFAASAGFLDSRRLNKQLVEVQQILRVLTGVTDGWRNHPAVRMWRGHKYSLYEYGVAVNAEYAKRFGRSLTYHKSGRDIVAMSIGIVDTGPPCWLGNEAFHASHRSNLLRKDPVWYGQFGWKEPNDLEYVWPS